MRGKEILPFVKAWMDTEGITLSEIRQTEKHKVLHGITYMWHLKKIRVNSQKQSIEKWFWAPGMRGGVR